MDRSRPYRELTPAAVIGGVLLGAVLNMGICFAGLQIGFTIVGSAVAAVLGFGVLRGILRVGTILEVNIFQTAASAVNTVNAGVIFTVPVLFLLGLESEINVPALILATIAGSMLGTVMIIPLRKQIIDYERLRFPEGTAVAAILRSPGAGVKKSRLLLGGIAVSGVVTLLTKIKKGGGGTLLPEHVDLGGFLQVPSAFSLVLAVSLLSLGAGFIAGRGGLVVLYGTLLNYWVLVPAAILLGWLPTDLPPEMAGVYDGSLDAIPHGDDAAGFIARFGRFTSRHVGIGMILGGAIAGILIALPALKAALGSLRSGGKSKPDDEREEMIALPALKAALGSLR
ncbi:MAG: OPT/YSL family transporter, partial [Planctomycetota bacterium]|nr:OPT/YSL family transporter [Planctomycetota bacterium]